MKLLLKLASALAAVTASSIEEIPSMAKFLDDMETHYNGEGAKYNRVFLQELT